MRIPILSVRTQRKRTQNTETTRVRLETAERQFESTKKRHQNALNQYQAAKAANQKHLLKTPAKSIPGSDKVFFEPLPKEMQAQENASQQKRQAHGAEFQRARKTRKTARTEYNIARGEEILAGAKVDQEITLQSKPRKGSPNGRQHTGKFIGIDANKGTIVIDMISGPYAGRLVPLYIARLEKRVK